MFARLKNLGINVSVIAPNYIRTNIFEEGIKNTKYNPKMLKDFGREKLDDVYKTWMDDLINSAMSPDVAVKKYIRQIKKDMLYIFDSKAIKDLMALKGKDLQNYEKLLLDYQEMQTKSMKDLFHKHGINLEDYM